ncbi:hypothetical protein G6730_05155 [Polynucleobacter paneuropaeus]|nr:hypothetical protein [Polynucleobacter paneuropaeus]
MFTFNLSSIAKTFTIIFSSLFALKFWSLCGGDILNHYPFISPDGFDWYLEGAYLTKLMGGNSMPDLPVLRPPIFVMITALDYFFGEQGLVIAIVAGLTIFGTYYFLVKIINAVDSTDGRSSWYAIPISIYACIYPINFIKPFILADSLAITFALASIYYFLRYHEKTNSRGYLISSAVLTSIGGLTQTYALLPFLVACSIAILFNLSRRNKDIVEYLFSIVFVAITYILAIYIWRVSIPHKTTPENFTLLKLTGDMFGFYVKTWSFYFFPLILFFIFSRSHMVILNCKNFCLVFFLSLTTILAFLLFFYQWPDARFTYYLWPWVLISFFTVVHFRRNFGLLFATFLIFSMIFLTPASYWGPSWDSVRVSVAHNWLGEYFSSHRVDRGLALCSEDCVGKNEFLKNSDPYVNSSISLYQRIRGL